MKQSSQSAPRTFTLGRRRAEAIAAVEGLQLTVEQAERFDAWDRDGNTPEEMRAEILKRYEIIAQQK